MKKYNGHVLFLILGLLLIYYSTALSSMIVTFLMHSASGDSVAAMATDLYYHTRISYDISIKMIGSALILCFLKYKD